ncbi:hypothetical protein V6Z11_A04G042300 [Gossypium hirsutum]
MAASNFGAVRGHFFSHETPYCLRFRRSKGEWTAYSQGTEYAWLVYMAVLGLGVRRTEARVVVVRCWRRMEAGAWLRRKVGEALGFLLGF